MYRTQTCFSNLKSFCIKIVKIMWNRRLAHYHVSIILNNQYYCEIFNVYNFSVTNPIYRILRRGPLKATDEIQYYVVSKEKKRVMYCVCSEFSSNFFFTLSHLCTMEHNRPVYHWTICNQLIIEIWRGALFLGEHRVFVRKGSMQ